jgi:hypothetical protein
VPEGRRRDQAVGDDRLQPPLRSQFRRAQGRRRTRRNRRRRRSPTSRCPADYFAT